MKSTWFAPQFSFLKYLNNYLTFERRLTLINWIFLWYSLGLRDIVKSFRLEKLNSFFQAPQLVFFREAVEHILRVARVFRQPGGHVLMVGLDGTGKSTTVQLACYITKCELYKLTLTRGYNILDFREDIKKVCKMAGVQGINTVFLLTDGDIVKESFLEDINCILNSGEVPDLFDNEEMDGIAMELKSAAAESQISDTRTEVYNFFIRVGVKTY